MSKYRKAGPARIVPSPAVRLWLYGIAGAAVPLLVIYGVVNAEQGAAWLAVAGALLAPASLTLAAANGLYLVLLLLGGMVFPLAELPGTLRSVAELLPAAALTELLGAAAVGESADGRWWLTLGVWALAAPVAAARTFRWSPAR